jgi:hypothetical protein
METAATHGGMKTEKRFADLMDILRVLPSNIVADIIYLLVVRVIRD